MHILALRRAHGRAASGGTVCYNMRGAVLSAATGTVRGGELKEGPHGTELVVRSVRVNALRARTTQERASQVHKVSDTDVVRLQLAYEALEFGRV